MNKLYSYKRHLSTRAVVTAGLLTGISIVLTRAFSVMVPLAGLPALRIGFGDIPIIISGILLGPMVGALTGTVTDLVGFMINPMGGAFFPGFTLSAALRGAIPGLIYWLIRSGKFRFNFNIINTITIVGLAFGVVGVMYSKGVLKVYEGIAYLYDKKLSPAVAVLYVTVILAFVLIPIVLSKKDKSQDAVYSLDKILFTVTIPYFIISLGLNTLWLSIMFDKAFLVFLPGRVLAGLVIIPVHSLIIFTLSKFFEYMKV
jgi:ECF transporter S component (folate family)